jgi:hypothetical protein
MANNLDKYLKIRDTISSGDCIFFSGRGGVSDLIKDVSGSEYSHVGIVLIDKQIGSPDTEDGRVHLIESTTLNEIPDHIDGTYRKGVQIVMLGCRLESYDGKAWIFPLKTKITDENLKKGSDWLFSCHQAKIKYEDIKGLLKAAMYSKKKSLWVRFVLAPLKYLMFWRYNKKEDLSRLFCSEMVIKFFEKCEVLPSTINPSLVLPSEVSQLPIFKDRIELI